MFDAVWEPLRDITAGTVAGSLAKFVEFPMDTVKVRMQDANSKYKNYYDCVSRMLKEEGFFSFYKGIWAPVAGAAAENATCFCGYTQAQNLYRWYGNYQPKEDLPWQAGIFSGLVAGVFVAHVLSPVELVKCKMQLENTLPVEKRLYRNVWHCTGSILRREGVPGLFKGHTATLARETPGNAAWFGFYNLCVAWLTPAGQRKEDLPGWKLALSGGVGGCTYWTAFFPADVVKTRLQTDPNYAKETLVSGLKLVYRESGLRGLYFGWSITMVRAFPANAVIFYMYETTSKFLERKFAPKAHDHDDVSWTPPSSLA